MDGEIDRTILTQRRGLALSKKAFYSILILSVLFPFFVLFFLFFSFVEQSLKAIFFVTFSMLSSIAGGFTFILVRFWEKKMRRTVSSLVKVRMAKLTESRAESQDQLRDYQDKLNQSHLYIEEMQRGFEHQIDLLQTSVAKNKSRVEEISLEMEAQTNLSRHYSLQCEDLKKERERLQEEIARDQEEFKHQLFHKEGLLQEYQQTISEQRMVIEKKQRYIAKLEGKVRDLMYEIRSLLQLEEHPPEKSLTPFLDISEQIPFRGKTIYPQVKESSLSPYDLSLQLQKYIDMAKNFTGIDHLGYMGGRSPRFVDVSSDSYAIDQRRFFDSFRDEANVILFVHSMIEDKFLFVNPLIKTLLGWSPEKFIKDFPQLMHAGYIEWRQALLKIQSLQEMQLKMVLKSKVGTEHLFQCHIGWVSQGPFVNHVIGLLSPKHGLHE
jgi:PAS domain-containing protein